MNFETLGLSSPILQAVKEKGYSEATPIQAQAIPPILEGSDLVATSQTGTGKTAAFALPLLSKLEEGAKFQCLILEPTRELALQVADQVDYYKKHTGLHQATLYGGVGLHKQTKQLQGGAEILTATPGRLLDHLERKNCRLDKIRYLVLDEVDRMLDMGFLPDVRRIVRKCARNRQTLLFSATIPPEIAYLASEVAGETAVRIDINPQNLVADTIDHALYPVATDQREELLIALMEQTPLESAIVFTRTKRDADRIAHTLEDKGMDVAVLHADRAQSERTRTMRGFREGKHRILVATDIAARGLDIAHISHVFNYQVPENADDYVHRIGRTGRATRSGQAITLVSAGETNFVHAIEQRIGRPIERRTLPDFPYHFTTLLQQTVPQAAKRRSRKRTSAR